MTSKERAELRAQANTLDTILMVGKGGVSETLIAEAEKVLDAREPPIPQRGIEAETIRDAAAHPKSVVFVHALTSFDTV